jgi:chorismate mutase
MNKFANNLEDYRNQLSQIDSKIIELLNQRALISKEIGILKVNNGIEIYQNDFWEKAHLIRSKTIESTILNDKISNQTMLYRTRDDLASLIQLL